MASPLDLGGDSAVYIENSTFSANSGSANGSDCDNGGRVVWRFNTFNRMNLVTHGTEGGLMRGCAKIEAYHNVFTSPTQARVLHFRGGNGVAFNNQATGHPNFGFHGVFAQYRIDNGIDRGWQKCTGFGSYDDNDPTVFEKGSHIGPDGANFLRVAGNPWTPGQWKGYGVRNSADGKSGFIYDNTANTIYYVSDHSPRDNSAPVFGSGDAYVIRKVNKCIDQIGWHGGDLMRVVNGVQVRPDGSVGYPNQVWTPYYVWNNTQNAVLRPLLPDRSNSSPGGPKQEVSVHVPNRDFFNQAGPDNPDCPRAFDGSCGVGIGPIAKRPATCTAGVGYWASDEGEWWASHSGPDGTLYRCTARNTWTRYYTPHPYPHPLADVASPAR
jgi:hypothetical protein